MPPAGAFSHFENSRLDNLPSVDRKRGKSLTQNSMTALTYVNRPRRSTDHGGGSGAQTRLLCPLKSRAHFPIGKPVAFVSNRKVLLAHPANRLSSWSNAVADDFVNRLAGRAEIETVVHTPNGRDTVLGARPAPCAWRTLRRYAEISRTSKPGHRPPTTNGPSTRSRARIANCS